MIVKTSRTFVSSSNTRPCIYLLLSTSFCPSSLYWFWPSARMRVAATVLFPDINRHHHHHHHPLYPPTWGGAAGQTDHEGSLHSDCDPSLCCSEPAAGAEPAERSQDPGDRDMMTTPYHSAEEWGGSPLNAIKMFVTAVCCVWFPFNFDEIGFNNV